MCLKFTLFNSQMCATHFLQKNLVLGRLHRDERVFREGDRDMRADGGQILGLKQKLKTQKDDNS